jgi:hypothetical protein
MALGVREWYYIRQSYRQPDGYLKNSGANWMARFTMIWRGRRKPQSKRCDNLLPTQRR